MRSIPLCFFLICISLCVNAQCSISPFIQQNYELDAALLVLREIQDDPSDPDYDNPFLSQTRVDYHLEKLSAMYENPQNDVNIDSLFNQFQFHVNELNTQFKLINFRVDTNISWVQALKDTGQTGITAIDDFFSLYQFSLSSFLDNANSGQTRFSFATSYDYLNMYALLDDLQNTSNEIEVFNGFTTENLCNYTGIPYQIPDLNSISGVNMDVVKCDIFAPTSFSNGAYIFSFNAYCLASPVNQSRYVTVSDDCSQVNFSRTLSTADVHLTDVTIYPNPTSDILNLQGITNIKNVELYSIQGKNMKVSLHNTTIVDVSSLQSGVYFLKVMDAQNRSIVRKFIKK